MNESSGELQATIARFMPYLQEIRNRALCIAAVFIVGALLGFVYFEPIIKLVLKFYDLKGMNIVFTSPFQFINLSITTGIVVGGIAAFPLILYQIVSFLKPALKTSEYRLLISSIPFSIFLFVIGFLFGAWIMKFVVVIFSQQSSQLQVQNLWDIENFLTNIFQTAFMLGILFQFPVIMTPLIRLRVIKYSLITKLRLPVYIALVVFTVMMPPTDLLSDTLIFLPLAFLFEITLLSNRHYKNR